MIKRLNQAMRYKSKKIGATALLVIFVLASAPLYASAGSVGGTGGSLEVTQLGQVANDIAVWVTEFSHNLAKIAAAKFRKMLLDTMVNEIIKWIQGKGDPKFVNDLGGFLDEVGRDAGALTLQKITGQEFMAGLCQPSWALSIRATLEPVPTFGEKALCSLSQIQTNYEEFINHFTKGGWSAWIKISESRNNPYMVYMTALNEKLTRQASKQTSAKEEATFGGGFLSDKVCNTISYYENPLDLNAPPQEKQTESGLTLSESEFAQFVSDNEMGPYYEVECVKWETRTPGKILADATSKSLFKDMDWLLSNEEWESYIVAIGDAIVNRLTQEGVKKISSYDTKTGNSVNFSGIMDITPPATAATIIDPWRIKLSPNEPSKTAYTLDGSEPNLYSKTMGLYQEEPIMVVNSTYPGSTPASLKWRSMDTGSNIENARSLPLSIRTPFNLSEISSYITTQDASIPQNIQNDIKSLINSQSIKMARLANDTSIPKNLIDNLKNYIAIEDLRISLGKATVIPVATLNQLKAVATSWTATSTLYTISDFINSTQSIAVLADMSAEAKDIKQARTDLKTVVNYILEAVGTGFANITITQFADMLSLSPEFDAVLTETENVIAERSLIKLKPWDTTKIYTTVAAVDDHSFVLLSNKPSLIEYSSNIPHFLHGYYTQKLTLPEDNKEYTVNYLAEWKDAAGNTQKEKLHSLKVSAPFPKTMLPYVVDLVPPIAEIKNASTLTKDADGFFTLDPSPSVDFDITPNIAGYEWSFIGATSTEYDWKSFDQNRDGSFETYGCVYIDPLQSLCTKSYNTLYTGFSSSKTSSGFEEMKIVNADEGIIKVKLSPATTTSEIRTIKLRVTDDEGLWTEKSATINLP